MPNHNWFTKITIGTEAVEAAVKMAIQYYTELPVPEPQRVNIISRKSSYHGNTLGSLAVGHHASRRRIYESLLSKNIHHVPQCYPYRRMDTNESTEDYVARLAQELEDEFQRLGPSTVCAFVAETMPGAVSKTESRHAKPANYFHRHLAVSPHCLATSRH